MYNAKQKKKYIENLECLKKSGEIQWIIAFLKSMENKRIFYR